MKENDKNNQNGDLNYYLIQAFENLGKSQQEIISDLGNSQPYVSALMNGKKKVGKEIAKKLKDLYGFDELATLTGNIPTITNTNGNVVIGDHNTANNGGEIESKEKVSSKIKTPYYDVDFAGGWSSEELFSNVQPSYYISAPEFERAEFACNLRGHSISKRIKSGSIVGLKEIQDWQTYFPTNELYGVITKNDLRTIKIVKRSKEEGFLDLIPDALPEYNDPPYEAEKIPIKFIQKMFQVVAWGFYERLVM